MTEFEVGQEVVIISNNSHLHAFSEGTTGKIDEIDYDDETLMVSSTEAMLVQWVEFEDVEVL